MGGRILTLILALWTLPAAAGGDPDLGRRLYWEGIGADGNPVQAVVQGDVPVAGAHFACVNCHRPSGFGSSEGGVFVPPITGPVLFSQRALDRNRLFQEFFQESQPPEFWSRVRQPRMRPGYDAESLARALADGLDSAGQPLSEVMPRYRLGEADVANLEAFLRQLSTRPDPGVSGAEIHFATVFGPDTPRAEREAVLSTMRAFFRWMNEDTKGDTQRPEFSPYYRSEFLDSYRLWRLHVWDLEGPPETWQGQLARYREEHPVFALVSGVVQGPWEPVGRFCDQHRIPCLFPNAELPAEGEGSYGYSLHFSRGLRLEAEALARYLAQRPPGRIQQLWVEGPVTDACVVSFRAAARRGGLAGALQRGVPVPVAELGASLQAMVAALAADDVLVVWPGAHHEEVLEALVAGPVPAGQVVLPAGSLEQASGELPGPLRDRLLFTWPYERPDAYHPRSFRVRAWLRTRGLEISHPRLQFQTYYALTLVEHGLRHALSDFNRDYLVELIEHEAENKLNPGTHPELALGPGQRFASKGAYLVQLDPDSKGGFRPVSEWIVP